MWYRINFGKEWDIHYEELYILNFIIWFTRTKALIYKLILQTIVPHRTKKMESYLYI